MIEHVSAVCRSTEPRRHRLQPRERRSSTDVTVAELADRNPNLVGLKDGVGNIELMTRTYARVGDRLTYIGGLPTAETFALPLLQLGVSTYSSAIFNFVPEFALGFYADVRAQDRDGGLPQAQRVRHPLPRHPRPDEGVRRLDRQGRHDRDRPLRGPGAAAAAGPDRRTSSPSSPT